MVHIVKDAVSKYFYNSFNRAYRDYIIKIDFQRLALRHFFKLG
jgi:hypothetical protein